MTGKELQLKIKKSGRTQKDIAEEMGMDPTQWTPILKQKDVKSGIIESVAQILGLSMAQMYGETEGDSISADHNSTSFKGATTCDPRLLDIIQTRDKQLDKAQDQIDRLLTIIENH